MSKHKILATADGIRLRLDYAELEALQAEIEAAYKRASQDGIPAHKGRGITKTPVEVMIIELCHKANVRLKKQQVELKLQCTVTLKWEECCALWELWEHGILQCSRYNQWAADFVTHTFTKMHPLLLSA